MIKKLTDLLAEVRKAEKSALAILAAGGVGSRVDGTVARLRATAEEIEERLRLLKQTATPEPKPFRTAAVPSAPPVTQTTGEQTE